MEAPGLLTVLKMLVDIPHCCPIVKNFGMDVSVDQMLMGLPSLHLTHWLLRDVHCADRVSLSSDCQAVTGTPQVLMTKLTSNARRKGPVGVLKRVYQMMPFLLLN